MKYVLLFSIVFFNLFGFSQEPNKAVVEVNKMNVVYRGVSNPLTLSMPGTVSFEASAPGLKKIDDYGNYVMNPGSGLTVDIELRGKLPNGEIVTAIKTLRIKDISKPVGSINGLGCGEKCLLNLKKEELREAKIDGYIKDYLVDLDIRVVSFSIKLPNDSIVKFVGDTINDSNYNMIDKLKQGYEISIIDIKWTIFGTTSTYKLRPLQPIKIRLLN
ncbi:GldM family protein [Hanstruepera flava]|uniref:GldM family protein n=1 Tax=Hanstruepera flava TaxID=2930218 RepID=UPI0020294E9D|nr:GldM family protein [Hanstruepera flava]